MYKHTQIRLAPGPARKLTELSEPLSWIIYFGEAEGRRKKQKERSGLMEFAGVDKAAR